MSSNILFGLAPTLMMLHLCSAFANSRVTLTAGLLFAMLNPCDAQDTVRVHSDGAPKWGTTSTLIERTSNSLGALNRKLESVRIVQLYALGDTALVIAGHDDARDYLIFANLVRGTARELATQGTARGQISRVSQIGLQGDSLVVVTDLERRAMLWIGLDGVFRSEVALEGKLSAFRGSVVDMRGNAWINVSKPGAKLEGVGSQQQFKRIGPRGTIDDSVAVTRVGNEDSFYTVFHRNFVFIMEPDATITSANTGEYKIWRRRTDGSVLEMFRKWTPVPVESTERDEWLAYMRARSDDPTKVSIRAVKPAIREMLGDDSGRLWVRVHSRATKLEQLTTTSPAAPTITWRELPTFEVFDRGGVFLGRVELPARTELLSVHGDVLWTVATGAPGREVIKSFTMRR